MTVQVQECKQHSPESPPSFQKACRQLLCCIATPIHNIQNAAVNQPQESEAALQPVPRKLKSGLLSHSEWLLVPGSISAGVSVYVCV